MPLIRRQLGRRHHGADIAHGEDVARLGLGENAGIDTGIGAAHDQNLGRLAFARELLEQLEMLAVVAQAEVGKALEESFQCHGGL